MSEDLEELVQEDEEAVNRRISWAKRPLVERCGWCFASRRSDEACQCCGAPPKTPEGS